MQDNMNNQESITNTKSASGTINDSLAIELEIELLQHRIAAMSNLENGTYPMDDDEIRWSGWKRDILKSSSHGCILCEHAHRLREVYYSHITAGVKRPSICTLCLLNHEIDNVNSDKCMQFIKDNKYQGAILLCRQIAKDIFHGKVSEYSRMMDIVRSKI